MNLEEAIAAFEADFTLVSDEIGQADDENPNRRHLDRAPNGDRYVVMTSGGVVAAGEGPPALFADEAAAAGAWLREAWSYADKRGGKDLYWARRPVYEEAEFVGVDQAAMLNGRVFAQGLALRLGAVEARLVVSRGAAKKKAEDEI